VVVFQPLKHYHAKAIDQATRTGYSDFNKIELLFALISIRQQAFKKSRILSVFRKTGLVLFNSDVVFSHLQEYSGYSQPSCPTTPPRSIQQLSTTPRTVQSLKCHANFLWNADPSLPSFKHSLSIFIKGSVAQAHVAAQTLDALQRTQAAELAQSNRQNRSRRLV
ncbi:hypothetical protein C7212DRAFT_41995, partial [Tuber magnatum]